MSSSVPGAVPVAMINGRSWEFTHDGKRYQIMSLNGSEVVRLYVQEDGRWLFGHARDTNGHGAAWIARQMLEDITAPVGVSYAREWLALNTILGTADVRALSNSEVMAETSQRFPGGWDGLLRHIGAV
jgi:hypothetical protein